MIRPQGQEEAKGGQALGNDKGIMDQCKLFLHSRGAGAYAKLFLQKVRWWVSHCYK